MYNNASNYSFISIDDTKQKNKNKNNKYKNISYISPIKRDNIFNNVSTYRLQKIIPIIIVIVIIIIKVILCYLLILIQK